MSEPYWDQGYLPLPRGPHTRQGNQWKICSLRSLTTTTCKAGGKEVLVVKVLMLLVALILVLVGISILYNWSSSCQLWWQCRWVGQSSVVTHLYTALAPAPSSASAPAPAPALLSALTPAPTPVPYFAPPPAPAPVPSSVSPVVPVQRPQLSCPLSHLAWLGHSHPINLGVTSGR